MALGRKRPGVHRDYARVPAHVEPETTPPPQEMPAVARSRTPTPDEITTSFAAIEAQLSTLRDGLVQLWPSRHVHDEITAMRSEFRGYTQSMANAEATARGAWDAVKELMPRLDRMLQSQGAVEQLAGTVAAIDGKLDGISDRFAAIETAQETAAVRFDEHDKRDQEIAASVASIDTRVGALEQRHLIADAGDKRELALSRRRRRLLQTLIGAVSTGVGWLAGLLTQ